MATRLVPDDYSSLLDKHDTFLFDCDGVIWNGDSIVDGVIDVLSMLRSKRTPLHSIPDLELTTSFREEHYIRYKQCHQVEGRL
jgi:hypothetical protein